ncbi:hypothetical protein ACFE04_018554 [Oxalis oulophora]
MEDTEIGLSFRSSFGVDTNSANSFRANNNNEDEIELQWAAIERLPTFERIRTSLFDGNIADKDDGDNKKIVDVTKLGAFERRLFIEKLINQIDEDNHALLLKIKERINKVDMQFPTVEVRYKNLSVETDCEIVHGKPLPTLWNTLKTVFLGIAKLGCHKSPSSKIKILKDVSGIIKPSRMTLLLGPPGCGKTTLLQALAVKLTESLKEVSRRERQGSITPEPDIDTYMKAISVEGLRRTLQTDYILKAVSEKNQAGYWYREDEPYRYISVNEFADKFAKFHVGHELDQELSSPFVKTESHKNALSFNIYSVKKWELFKACLMREWLLMKRNSFVHVFKSAQVLLSIPSSIPLTSSISVFVSFDCFHCPKSTNSSNCRHFLFNAYLPAWLEWCFWLSPLTYAEIAASVNEFLAPRWQTMSSSNISVGDQILNQHNLNYSQNFYWISIGVLVGFWLLFNFAFTCALTYLKSPGRSRAIISHEKFSCLEGRDFPHNDTQRTLPESENIGMILPFEPIAISFENVQYFVDTPQLLLLKRGGQMVYSGELGENSNQLIQYFEEKQRTSQRTQCSTAKL